MKIAVPRELKKLSAFLSAPIYIVGGFVRNSVLFNDAESLNYTDVDICGSLTPDQIREELSDIASVKDVNPRIGTVLIIYCGKQFEYTTFRRDSYPIGGKHTPDSVEFVKDMKTDALRRDFTVNALYCDVMTNEVIDAVGGLDDIRAKRIRTVRSPNETFGEDGLRLLRMIRFACELGFDIEPETLKGAKESRDQLRDITVERKREELQKILESNTKYNLKGTVPMGIRKMCEIGLWKPFWDHPVFDDIYHKDFSAIEKSFSPGKLYIFALILCRNDHEAIDQVFGADGLGYPKETVKRMHLDAELVYRNWDDVEYLLFIAKYSNLNGHFTCIAKAMQLPKNPGTHFRSITFSSLPLKPSGIGVTEEMFHEAGIYGAERAEVLDQMMHVIYKRHQKLSKSEIIRFLKDFKGGNNGN